MNDTMKEMEKRHRRKKIIIIIVSIIIVLAVAGILVGYFMWKRQNSDTDKRYDTEVEVFNLMMEQAASTPPMTQEELSTFELLLKQAPGAEQTQ